jgi:hypothetical protein
VAKGYSLEVGDSIEIVNGFGKHLHFIIAEESNQDNSLIMLVYVSSSKTVYKDDTTIITPEEHQYISNSTDESWIRYQNVLVCSREEIIPLITRHYGRVSDLLLSRIQEGFEKSKKVSKGIKKLYNEWKMNKLFDSLK